jgi:hypothetical protein
MASWYLKMLCPISHNVVKIGSRRRTTVHPAHSTVNRPIVKMLCPISHTVMKIGSRRRTTKVIEHSIA